MERGPDGGSSGESLAAERRRMLADPAVREALRPFGLFALRSLAGALAVADGDAVLELDLDTLVCFDCGRGFGLSHLGSCSLSTMRGGSGIVGYRVAQP